MLRSDAPGALHPVKNEEREEERKLDRELYHAGDHVRHGYAKPRKVNFAEERRVANKGDGCAVHAICKVRPAGNTRQIKEQRRHTVRGELSHLPKDDSEDEGSEKRLEDVPERAQNRLFVLSDEIAPHEHRGEVAIAPQVSEVQIEPPGLRPDDLVPLFSG